jgi:hypothetical protein
VRAYGEQRLLGQSGGFVKAADQVHVLDSLAGRALHQVVDHREDDRAAGHAVGVDADQAAWLGEASTHSAGYGFALNPPYNVRLAFDNALAKVRNGDLAQSGQGEGWRTTEGWRDPLARGLTRTN